MLQHDTPPSLPALVAEAQEGTGLLSAHNQLVWGVACLAGTNPLHSSRKAARSLPSVAAGCCTAGATGSSLVWPTNTRVGYSPKAEIGQEIPLHLGAESETPLPGYGPHTGAPDRPLCPVHTIMLTFLAACAGASWDPGVSYPCSFSDGGQRLGPQPVFAAHTDGQAERSKAWPISRLGGGTPQTSALTGAGYGQPATCQSGLLTKETLHSQR